MMLRFTRSNRAHVIKMRGMAGLIVGGMLILLAACGSGASTSSGSGGNHAPLYDTQAVTVTVGGPEQTSSLSMQPLVFLGSFADIHSVSVVVSGLDRFGVFQSVLATANLTLVEGSWSGTIQGLPIGPTLTFTAHGYNGASVEIYSGTTT